MPPTRYRVTVPTPFGADVREFTGRDRAERFADSLRENLTGIRVETFEVAYVATTEDGRYGLTAADEYGYHYLYRIVTDPKPADYDAEMERLVGPWGDYEVGAVANPENIETAAIAADEEAAALAADAAAEFGGTR